MPSCSRSAGARPPSRSAATNTSIASAQAWRSMALRPSSTVSTIVCATRWILVAYSCGPAYSNALRDATDTLILAGGRAKFDRSGGIVGRTGRSRARMHRRVTADVMREELVERARRGDREAFGQL